LRQQTTVGIDVDRDVTARDQRPQAFEHRRQRDHRVEIAAQPRLEVAARKIVRQPDEKQHRAPGIRRLQRLEHGRAGLHLTLMLDLPKLDEAEHDADQHRDRLERLQYRHDHGPRLPPVARG